MEKNTLKYTSKQRKNRKKIIFMTIKVAKNQ